MRLWPVIPLFLLGAVMLGQPANESPYVIEKVLGKLQYAAAIGWFKEGYLLVADLPDGKLTRIDAQGTSIFRENTFASSLDEDSDGRICLADPRQHRIVRIDKKGKADPLASQFEGKPFNGPARLAVTKNNHIWFTDGAFATADRERPQAHYGVYRVSSKGELTLAAKLTGRPDGIALSPDEKTLYVVDSDARTVFAWDLDRQGAASGQRALIRTRQGVPTGLMAGPDGRLYVAARNIEVYSPKGEFEFQIEIGEKPADMAFGDSDRKTLYVAARTSVYRVRFRPEQAGKGGNSH